MNTFEVWTVFVTVGTVVKIGSNHKIRNCSTKSLIHTVDFSINYHQRDFSLRYFCCSITSVFFNPGSANSLLGSLKVLLVVLIFKFSQMIINDPEVPRLENGWKALHYFSILSCLCLKLKSWWFVSYLC